MCLLTFGGLDHREQLNVLSSVGNDYDLKKVSHALRIQLPTCSGKPAHRRDYLGCGRRHSNPLPTSLKSRPKPFSSKGGKGKNRGYVLVAENGQDEAEGDEIFYDDDEDDPEDEAYEVDDDGDADDAVEALAQDMDLADDPELVDAFATILQRKKGQKPHGKGSGSKGQSQSFPFQAKGEVTVDQRTRAIRFLKSVTPCTSYGLKGHWAGNAEYQNSRKGSKGSAATKKKPLAKKKSAHYSFFVVGELPAGDSEKTTAENDVLVAENGVSFEPGYGAFTNRFEMEGEDAESYMVLRAEELCEHASYNGGGERKSTTGPPLDT